MRKKLRAVVRESIFHQKVIMQPVFGFLSLLRIFKNSELTPVNSSIKKPIQRTLLLPTVLGLWKLCKH